MPRRLATPEFRCPKCGATTALWLPDSVPGSQSDVTLKCLDCACLVRLPRDQVVTEGSPWRAPGTSI